MSTATAQAAQNTVTTGKEILLPLFTAQKNAMAQRPPRSYAERIDALDALMSAMLRYENALVESCKSDFGNRAAQETRLLEVFPIVDEIRHTKRHLKGWMRSEHIMAGFPWWPSSGRIVKQPLGVVGIIGAWNYQILLSLSPLVSVLSAGNHAMIKLAEAAPATADVIRKLIAETFPADYVTVAPTGSDISAAFSTLPFDHIIFTGSGRVGRVVMRAAAENLTPVTLELGGKSPALVHESYPIGLAADRICAGKFWNGGQTCVAPDYAVVQESMRDRFMTEATAVLKRRLPTIAANPDYTHMINRGAWERMTALVEDARNKGGQVVQINPASETVNVENRVFPPTLIINVNDSMRVMQEEIFGPILPVMTVRSLDDGIAYINSHDRPLALYYFDNDNSRIDHVLERTTSGGVTINDCIFHLAQNNLPFGGVGASGMGAYHGEDGFNTFSKRKGVMVMNGLVSQAIARVLKPPYTGWTDRIISFLLGRPPNRVGG
jgi:coniferyl-aldehyde dehydrogenase